MGLNSKANIKHLGDGVRGIGLNNKIKTTSNNHEPRTPLVSEMFCALIQCAKDAFTCDGGLLCSCIPHRSYYMMAALVFVSVSC